MESTRQEAGKQGKKVWKRWKRSKTPEELRIAFLLILSILPAGTSTGKGVQQPDISQENIYRAYTEGRSGLWKEEIDRLNARYIADSNEVILDRLVMAQYGYIAFCLKENLKEESAEELKKARINLDRLLIKNPGNPTYIAIKAAFTGFEMGVNPLKAIFLANEARKLTNLAYNTDSLNCVCISVKASQLHFTPPLFGGNINRAITYYLKLISIYESDTQSYTKSWQYINSYVLLASAYEKQKDFANAARIYERIIDIDPDISWVNNKLYPECLSQMAKTTKSRPVR
jgi:tetratricopeptide (TPR) repeat protein